MEFWILGPLEVVKDGIPLALGPAKQRTLLAILVTHANQVMSTDQVIDMLWGERPPGTASNTMQVYISGLRKILEDADPPDRLERILTLSHR